MHGCAATCPSRCTHTFRPLTAARLLASASGHSRPTASWNALPSHRPGGPTADTSFGSHCTCSSRTWEQLNWDLPVAAAPACRSAPVGPPLPRSTWSTCRRHLSWRGRKDVGRHCPGWVAAPLGLLFRFEGFVITHERGVGCSAVGCSSLSISYDADSCSCQWPSGVGGGLVVWVVLPCGQGLTGPSLNTSPRSVCDKCSDACVPPNTGKAVRGRTPASRPTALSTTGRATAYWRQQQPSLRLQWQMWCSSGWAAASCT